MGEWMTSTLVGGEWSASRPCRFTPWERAPGTPVIGGWVDPRAGLDDMEKWKIFFTLPGLELPPLLVVQPVASRYTDWAIPASLTLLVTLRYTELRWGLERSSIPERSKDFSLSHHEQ
jgi:hypothetical protein